MATPEDAKSMDAQTEDFLCALKDNTYNIKFCKYKIRDIQSGVTLVELENDSDPSEEQMKALEDDPQLRTIKYQFGPDFLELKTVGTTLEFSIGDQPVPNLVMIERHYFKKRLLKNYEFKFGFCIPNTINSWEAIYDMPEMTEEEKKEIIASPWMVKSDTFFYVNNHLIIHTKAEYDYSPFDEDN